MAMRRRVHERVWRTLDALAVHWRSLDRFTRGAHDLMLDLSLGSLRSSMGRYYAQGWGNVDVPSTFYAWLNTYNSVAKSRDEWLPRKIAVTFSPAGEVAPGVTARQGTFATPALEIRDLLPIQSHVAHVAYVTPSNSLSSDQVPLVILLAGTGEHGFSRRMSYAAIPLARKGIASLLLESPFYGLRKPPDQKGSKLKFVSDLTVLGRTTIEETCSLLKYASDDMGHEVLSVGGVSMGGLHAAMCSSLFPQEVGVVSYLGPPSAAPVFTQGLLSRFCEWQRLQSDLPKDTDPREVMNRFLALTDINNFPRPKAAHRAVFVVAEKDQYVPPHLSSSAFYELTKDRWQGARLFVIPGGHVSATVFGGQFFRDCVEFSLGLSSGLKW